LWCPLRFTYENDVRFVFTPICVVGGSCLCMLFVFINVYWCPTRFKYQMMFVSFNSSTTGITRSGTANLSGAPNWLPVFSGIRVAQSLGLCSVLFVLLSVVTRLRHHFYDIGVVKHSASFAENNFLIFAIIWCYMTFIYIHVCEIVLAEDRHYNKISKWSVT